MMGFFTPQQLRKKQPLPIIPLCEDCGLYRHCLSPKMPVYGKGATQTLIVGEAPGKSEDIRGIPFIGKAGRRLRSTLSKISIDLEGSFFKRLITLNASLFTNKIDNLPVQRFNLYPSYFSDFVPYTNYNSDGRTGVDMIINLQKKAGAFDYNLGIAASYITSILS